MTSSLRFLLVATLLGAPSLRAQSAACDLDAKNSFVGVETIRLWPGPAPAATGNACADTPTLTIFSPHGGGAGSGSAAVIFPGGAYVNLSTVLEGREVADWFTARGFTAFVLRYRLSSHGYILPVPLLDARRAIQLIRAHAPVYRINPARIVVVGFSAGGHLAALAGTQFVPGDPHASDPIDRVSSRPDFLVLGYPWIGAVTTDTSHLSYCEVFKLMSQCDSLRAKYDPVRYVSGSTPPTFIYHTYDDRTVPVEQSDAFFGALVKAQVPVEFHVFASGPHGSGLGNGDPALDQWPVLLETWLRAQGLLSRSP
jgi:acetyl esterase/lipase